MPNLIINEELKKDLQDFFKHERKPELISTYLHFIAKRDELSPVVVPSKKMIFQNLEKAIEILGSRGDLWRETTIRVGQQEALVNEHTRRIYICPFTGKVFADNTHPNPQDAIYDWVSKCPENTERKDGLKVKRFFISEDPEVIKNYIEKRKEPIVKTVYSSAITGSLFNSKEAVVDDFRRHHVKPIGIREILNQNRFELEESFLKLIQSELAEDNLADFVEAISQHEEFTSHVERWLEE